jgi:hypothetical protein
LNLQNCSGGFSWGASGTCSLIGSRSSSPIPCERCQYMPRAWCTRQGHPPVLRIRPESIGAWWKARSALPWHSALLIDLCHRRLYLHYEGADALSEGKYATSIPLLYAMDPHNDVMIAFGRECFVLVLITSLITVQRTGEFSTRIMEHPFGRSSTASLVDDASNGSRRWRT